MKYEMIFGDSQLFNHAPDDAVLVSVQLGDFRYFTEENLHTCKKFNIYKFQTCDTQLAMRRIIQETKRWTVEDKIAGRLPDVGAEYEMEGCVVEHLGNGAAGYQNMFHFRYPSGACGCAHERLAKPLETPEEKAERLRSEWVELAFDNMMRKEGLHSTECLDRIKCHFGSAYDALLSGALSVPTKGGK